MVSRLHLELVLRSCTTTFHGLESFKITEMGQSFIKSAVDKTTYNSCFDICWSLELSFRIKFSLPKIERLRTPAISKQQNDVAVKTSFLIISQIIHNPKRQFSRYNASCFLGSFIVAHFILSL
jgi:hypothetical protein